MRLVDILSAEHVTSTLRARDKDEALSALARLFGDLDGDEVYRVLRDRENLASTGVGSGVAIPHGRMAGLPSVVAALAVCPEGVEFDSVDGEPVHILVAILAPERSTKDHLKALASVSRLLRADHVRAELRAAPSDQALYQAVLARS